MKSIINEVFKELPAVKSRPMFGGFGLYKDGIIFGIVAYNEVYFKVDSSNLSDYQSAGSEPFTYHKGSSDKPIVMSYWKVPASVLKNRTKLLEWIEKSVKINSKKSTKRPFRAKT